MEPCPPRPCTVIHRNHLARRPVRTGTARAGRCRDRRYREM